MKLINVCNVEPEYFERIWTGDKTFEVRARKRRDPRLEAVEPGEKLYILETGGSKRLIGTTVTSVNRRKSLQRARQFTYRVHFLVTRKVAHLSRNIRKIQGWHRRKKL